MNNKKKFTAIMAGILVGALVLGLFSTGLLLLLA